MDRQLNGFKSLMGQNSFWLAQVAASPQSDSMPVDPEDTVVFFEAFESVHFYPRIIVEVGQWTFDGHGGNDLETVVLGVTFDLARPIPADDGWHDEYETVCQIIREVTEEASQESYAAGGEHLAQVSWEMVTPPDFVAADENTVTADDGTPLIVWYFNFLCMAKTT